MKIGQATRSIRNRGCSLTKVRENSMRRRMFYVLLFLLLAGEFGLLFGDLAGDLNGTAGTKYLTNNIVIHKGRETAQGFVRLNNGLTITQDGHGKLDTCTSFSGNIDLRETGTLELLNNLKLDSGVTFSSGGNINGHGNTLLLGGDLTIPTGKILHIMGDTIIDGKGKTLFLNEHAQLFVDTNVTLTLKNLSVVTTRNSLTNPAIRCAALKSKLALDNVMLAPVGDFLFKEGQFFVHNDVIFTGTSSFIYTSTRPSYITSRACLGFDLGTTFSFAPATNSNEQLVLSDPTSNLYLNGCSLLTTGTGMRLTKGLVLFDNKVTCNSYASSDIATPAPVVLADGYVNTKVASESAGPQFVSWSTDNKFLATVNYYTSKLQIFRFDGIHTPSLVDISVDTGSNPQAIEWSPDGKFLAATSQGENSLQIYTFDGTNAPVALGAPAVETNMLKFVSWSPDGKFLAITRWGFPGYLQVYTFNGTNTPQKAHTLATNVGNAPTGAFWSPEGKFLAVIANTTLTVYTFDGTNAPVALSGTAISKSASSAFVSWSPDGKFLALVTDDKTLDVYSFNGTNQPTIVDASTTLAHTPLAISWSPDGRFLATTDNASSLCIYSFDGTHKPAAVGNPLSISSRPVSVAWSHDGKYIAQVSSSESPETATCGLGVFKVNYINPTTTQPISQGIVFGKSSLGETYDCGVKLLSGARVEVIGKVNFDAA